MASGSSASLPSLHSSFSPSPSASSSAISAPTTTDSDANISNNPIAPLEQEVRFYDRCVLIPERPSSRPFSPHRLKTGTLEVNLNLPFNWKWPVLGSPSPKEKHFPSDMHESHAESDEGVLGAGMSASPPRNPANSTRHEAPQPVVLKLPYPIFRRKSHSPAHSSVVVPRSCLRHPTSPPSSAISASFGHRNTSPDANTDRISNSDPRNPKRRSASLPALPLEPNVETIPLRPCCEKCLTASEVHWNRNPLQSRGRLPTLQESSREHTPSQSRLDLREEEEEEEDWCAGLHFTKGALKLWRSASVDRSGALPAHVHALRQFQEGPAGAVPGKLLNSLVRVDEVDRKRGSSPNTSVIALTEDEKDAQSRSNLMITMPNLDRLKRIDRFDLPSPTGSGSENASEEDLFPLPSPNRLSPAASPSDSTTCLPAHISELGLLGNSTEPRQFEAAIRAKMAEKEKRAEKAKAQANTVVSASAALSAPTVSSNLTRNLNVSVSASSTSAPIPIPGPHLKEGVSHFHSNLDEIEWDPSLPDPDALPPDSTISLNSSPGSPMLSPSSGAGINHGIDYSNEGDKHTHQLPASFHSVPHIPSVHLPLSPRRRGSGSGSNSASPSPASAPSSASVPGLHIPSNLPPSYSSASVPPSSAPAMHGLIQSRSNTEELKSSPPSPQTARRRASVSNIMRASVNALRGLSPTSSVSVGSEAAGGVSYSRGLIV